MPVTECYTVLCIYVTEQGKYSLLCDSPSPTRHGHCLYSSVNHLGKEGLVYTDLVRGKLGCKSTMHCCALTGCLDLATVH